MDCFYRNWLTNWWINYYLITIVNVVAFRYSVFHLFYVITLLFLILSTVCFWCNVILCCLGSQEDQLVA